MELKTKTKIVLALVATLLAVILVIQNTETVETKVLFLTLLHLGCSSSGGVPGSRPQAKLTNNY